MDEVVKIVNDIKGRKHQTYLFFDGRRALLH